MYIYAYICIHTYIHIHTHSLSLLSFSLSYPATSFWTLLPRISMPPPKSPQEEKITLGPRMRNLAKKMENAVTENEGEQVKAAVLLSPEEPISENATGLRSTGVNYNLLGVRGSAQTTAVSVPLPTTVDMGLRSTGISLATLDKKPTIAPPRQEAPTDLGLKPTGIALGELEEKKKTDVVYRKTEHSRPVLRPSSVHAGKAEFFDKEPTSSVGTPVHASQSVFQRSTSISTPIVSASFGLRSTGVSLNDLERKQSAASTSSAASSSANSITSTDMGLRSTGISLANLDKKSYEESAPMRRSTFSVPKPTELGLRSTGVSLRDLEKKSSRNTVNSVISSSVSSSTRGLRPTGVVLSELEGRRNSVVGTASPSELDFKAQLRSTGRNLSFLDRRMSSLSSSGTAEQPTPRPRSAKALAEEATPPNEDKGQH